MVPCLFYLSIFENATNAMNASNNAAGAVSILKIGFSVPVQITTVMKAILPKTVNRTKPSIPRTNVVLASFESFLGLLTLVLFASLSAIIF